MAIDSNVLFKGMVPDTVGSISKGFELGSAIKNAPLLRKQQEQVLAINQAKLDSGSIGRAGLASAKTTQFKDGTTLFALPDGTSRIVGADGVEILDPKARIDAIKSANESGIIQAGGEAFSKAHGSARGGAVGESDVIDITTENIRKETAAEKSAARSQGFIDIAYEAGDGLAETNRTLELLDIVETGGIEKANLAAKQMFGIEGADEGELSNLLGKNVLSQLKVTFGSAFTENEGKRLERIDANYGKSTASNRRLLENAKKITERAVKRGIKEAERAGQDDVVAELSALLDATLSSDEEPPKKDEGQVMVDSNGNRARVFIDGTFEELP